MCNISLGGTMSGAHVAPDNFTHEGGHGVFSFSRTLGCCHFERLDDQ